jgi:membrane-bound lytic murein transglycosylase C
LAPTRIDFGRVDRTIPEKAHRWAPVVAGVTRKSLVDPALVLAVMHTESSFDPLARSGAGACGLMQLIPETGARAAFAYLTGRQCSVAEASLFRPDLNIVLGVAYLEWLWTRRFSGIVQEVPRAYVCVAAYNAGPSRISRWLSDADMAEGQVRAAKYSVTQSLVQMLTTDLPWPETRYFVKCVAARWPRYRRWLRARSTSESSESRHR